MDATQALAFKTGLYGNCSDLSFPVTHQNGFSALSVSVNSPCQLEQIFGVPDNFGAMGGYAAWSATNG